MQNIRNSVIRIDNTLSIFIKMKQLKYLVIKTKAQYNEYCNKVEELKDSSPKIKEAKEEIELLEVLIEKYDAEHNTFSDADPIELLKYLMREHKMKSVALAQLLGVSEGLVSDMLHCKKGISKETIRFLSQHFKLSQDAFNRPYKLKSEYNSHLRNAGVMNTPKELSSARQSRRKGVAAK